MARIRAVGKNKTLARPEMNLQARKGLEGSSDLLDRFQAGFWAEGFSSSSRLALFESKSTHGRILPKKPWQLCFEALKRYALLLKASRRGQDKRGRRRSAAIPPKERSRGSVYKMLQNITKCNKICQCVPHLNQNMAKCWDLWTFCENTVCPDPVLEASDLRGEAADTEPRGDSDQSSAPASWVPSFNGYLGLQGNILFRTSQLKHFPKLLARERLGTRFSRSPFLAGADTSARSRRAARAAPGHRELLGAGPAHVEVAAAAAEHHAAARLVHVAPVAGVADAVVVALLLLALAGLEAGQSVPLGAPELAGVILHSPGGGPGGRGGGRSCCLKAVAACVPAIMIKSGGRMRAAVNIVDREHLSS